MRAVRSVLYEKHTVLFPIIQYGNAIFVHIISMLLCSTLPLAKLVILYYALMGSRILSSIFR
jgi:hypothetical protein